MMQAKWWKRFWNPWRGCHPVRPKCALCYNRQPDSSFARFGRDFDKVERAKDATFYAPLRYPPGTAVAVCLGSDFFIEEADDWRGEAWDVMLDAMVAGVGPFMIPTSRPERIAQFLGDPKDGQDPGPWFWDRIWFLCSIADQADADELLPTFLQVPLGHLGVSHEPATGPVDWGKWLPEANPGPRPYESQAEFLERLAEEDRGKIAWIISGGANHVADAPLDVDWMRSDRDQAAAAGIPFFYKGAPKHLTHPQPAILDGRQWLEGPPQPLTEISP